MALWVFWPYLEGPYWSFIDNAAAQWVLSKGYSSAPEANVLTTLFWAAVVSKGADPWFERVPSKANCSDSISRADESFVVQQNWKPCGAQLDEMWDVLRRASEEELRNLPKLAAELVVAAKFVKT